MATCYSNTVNYWRAWVDYTTALSNTTFSVTITGFGVQAQGYGFEISSGVSSMVWLDGGIALSASGGMTSGYGGYDYTSHWNGSYTKTHARGHSAYTVYVGISAQNASGFMNGSVSSSSGDGDHAFTVPALDSYTVSFNANGGTNAPGNQTKWYGETLTIYTTQPIRNGYTFLGWATSSTGAVVYSPGSAYTADAGITLYAVWKINYIQPTISDLSALRCDSSGASSNNGTYIRVTGSWAVDKTMTPSNVATNLKIEYRAADSTTWTTAVNSDPASASGSLASTIGGGGIATGSAYYVRVTISDSGGNMSKQSIVPAQFRPLDFANTGKSYAFGQAASDSAIGGDFFTPARFHDAIYCNEQHFVVNGANVRVEDFVTVQGETTTTAPLNIPWSWRYRKWNSGILELWGEGNFVNWTIPNSYNGLYYNGDCQATYPVTLAVVYANLVATVTSETGLMHVSIQSDWATGCRFYVTDTWSRARNFLVKLYVHGRWK